jgi:hypothetical protein
MFIEGGNDFIDHFEKDDNAVYGIGPGLGTNEKTAKVFYLFKKLFSAFDFGCRCIEYHFTGSEKSKDNSEKPL